MKRIGSSLDVPLVCNQLHGGHTPILPQSQLKEMGFRVAIYPTAGLLAAARALQSVYDAHTRDKPVDIPLYDFHDFVVRRPFGRRDGRPGHPDHRDVATWGRRQRRTGSGGRDRR